MKLKTIFARTLRDLAMFAALVFVVTCILATCYAVAWVSFIIH